MHELMSVLAVRIVDAAVAAALIAGLAALAMVLTRQPSRRRALARAGAIGTLLVIPLIGLRPFAPVDLLGPVRFALEPWIGRGSPGWPHWAAVAARTVPIALLGVYVAGVALGLGRIALGAFGSGWIARNSRAASDETQAIYDALPSSCRRRPALRVSDRTARPVLLGAVRPTILIPPALDRDGPPEAIRLTLLHELAHAEASDTWFGLAMELASALWFWLPPVRWIGRQTRLDQEFLADRRAADDLGPSSARYASTLVEIAAARDVPRAAGPAPSAGSALLPRVLMLIRCPFPVEGRPPRWWRVLLGLATAAALLIATDLTLGARARRPTPGPLPHDLTIPRLVLGSNRPESQATTLPIRLPPDFDLGFDVDVSPADLVRIEVLGHYLASGEPSPDPAAFRTHHVTFRRRGGVLLLGLDEGPLLSLPGDSTDEWLTARGLPGTPITLRRIRLSW